MLRLPPDTHRPAPPCPTTRLFRSRADVRAFVTALQTGDPGGLADTLALWSEGYDVPRDSVVRAAERLVARHGGGRIVLGALIADFLPILRNERLVLPPDLLLIFRALLTIDGVLTGIQPDFDLSGAMTRAEIGRGSCRERVCQYGINQGVAVPLKKKK